MLAQAGVTLGELMAALVPAVAGWSRSCPGTQHVTVGGAIASDIHGKNHGSTAPSAPTCRRSGCSPRPGELLELDPDSELFAATLGGMGLTGLVVWARIPMRAVPSPLLAVDTDRVADLDAALAALQAPGGRHRVAWLDLIGRAPGVAWSPGPSTSRLAAPTAQRWRPSWPRARPCRRWFPGGLLNPASIAAFNELRFR